MLFDNLTVRDRWLTTEKVVTNDGVIHVAFAWSLGVIRERLEPVAWEFRRSGAPTD